MHIIALKKFRISLRFYIYVCIFFQALPSDIAATRQSLLDYLTFSLGGDALAAEYLLLHLLSQVMMQIFQLRKKKMIFDKVFQSFD